ncbi:hypothetical protein BJ546DRAFT_1063646 [Cryomyces antarcticus]|nr:hypothetical protein LTR04_000111 [Oleoguttula sp. CCFEE 6159]
MVSRKEMAHEVSVTDGATSAPLPASKLPAVLRFPLLAILSLSASYLCTSLAAGITGYELASVSRSLNEPWQIGAVLGWKVFELAVGWFARYDYQDVAALMTLSHLPFHYLLATCYGVSYTTSTIALAIDVLSNVIPFALLCPRSPVHNANAPKAAVPNRAVIHNYGVTASSALLGAAVYAVTVYAAYYSYLPVYLIVHFDGLRSLARVHDATVTTLLLPFLPLGWAASHFLFSASAGASHKNLRDIRREAFNPATATLGETVAHNLWGHSKRSKVLINRTVTLVLFSAANIWFRTFVTVEGTDAPGAAGWASVWAVAATLTGVAYEWLGRAT